MLFVLFCANCFYVCGTQSAINIFIESDFDFCHFVMAELITGF